MNKHTLILEMSKLLKNMYIFVLKSVNGRNAYYWYVLSTSYCSPFEEIASEEGIIGRSLKHFMESMTNENA